MTVRIGSLGLILAIFGVLLLGVPIIGWTCYALGLGFSCWGVFRAQPRLAWWGVAVSAVSVILRLTLAIFIVG